MTIDPLIPKKLYGIIGNPLKHSLSPYLHNSAFQKKRFACSYLTWEISKEKLPEFMLCFRSLPISGLSVTIPHKRNIMLFLDELTPEAKETKAVNTLFWRDNFIYGDNTDCLGFIFPLQERDLKPKKALILGGGGAALACLKGLGQLNTQEIYVAMRRPEQASPWIKQKANLISWDQACEIKADLLVNATPLGMYGKWQTKMPIRPECLVNFSIVYDLVYNPLQTNLLVQANQKGCITISGLEMFVQQALQQLKIWTGHIFDTKKVLHSLKDKLLDHS